MSILQKMRGGAGIVMTIVIAGALLAFIALDLIGRFK